ncbi:hypothetical protein AB0425_23940 [Actinosynnema sp. NPDC051121]
MSDEKSFSISGDEVDQSYDLDEIAHLLDRNGVPFTAKTRDGQSVKAVGDALAYIVVTVTALRAASPTVIHAIVTWLHRPGDRSIKIQDTGTDGNPTVREVRATGLTPEQFKEVVISLQQEIAEVEGDET